MAVPIDWYKDKMITDAQKWLLFSGIIFCGWLLYLLGPVLTPFAVAALLAYLGDPLVDRLEKNKLSRTLSVIIVFACMILFGLVLLVILVPLIENQLVSFINNIPRFIDWLQNTVIPALAGILGFDASLINLDVLKKTVMTNWQDVSDIAGRMLLKLSQSGQAIFAWLAYLLLIPVVTFYLLRDWDLLMSRIRDTLPRRHVGVVTKLARDCDNVLSEFLRGQLLVMFGQGIIYSIGLWIVGLEFALLIGMLAGLVSFVPYLGVVVGLVAALIAGIMQFNELLPLVYIVVVFGIGQAIEGMVLSPLLVGDRIGLHPVAVIFAVMAGGQLFGFVGVLIALPAAAVIVVLLRYFHQQYLESSFYTP